MPLSTTVIGSLPKPEYLHIPCWVNNSKHTNSFFEDYQKIMPNVDEKSLEDHLSKAVKEAVYLQIELGLDVITDGELARDMYVSYFCRFLDGFDFDKLARKVTRNGASDVLTFRAVSKLQLQVNNNPNNFAIVKDWVRAQSLSSCPVKVNIPGPMTIADTMVNCFYDDLDEQRNDLVKCIKQTIKILIGEGCKHIQIDEPVLVRYPSEALKYGISDLSKCFEGISDTVTKGVHICCGYPFYLDQDNYEKADKNAYLEIADALDSAGLDEIAIEDAHRRNNPKLFSHFKNTKVVLGVIDVARSRVESVEEIREHIKQVMEYIPKERIIIAPDCGLIYLTQDLIKQKLQNMVAAAKTF